MLQEDKLSRSVQGSGYGTPRAKAVGRESSSDSRKLHLHNVRDEVKERLNVKLRPGDTQDFELTNGATAAHRGRQLRATVQAKTWD